METINRPGEIPPTLHIPAWTYAQQVAENNFITHQIVSQEQK
jgi:hypothetical protein